MRPPFLDRFHRVTLAGDERWRAGCPNCGGHRTISVWPGRDRWMVKCWANCKPQDVMAHAGLRLDDTRYEHERRYVGGYTSTVHSPPPPNGESAAGPKEPCLRRLLREHQAGEAQRVPVEAPALPDDTPPLARRIYEDLLLRWSLRLGDEIMPDHRPLPYAVSEAVRGGLCRHEMQASRAIHWLEDNGLIWSPGKTPIRIGRPGNTRTFLPGVRPDGPLPEEACRVEAAAGMGGAVRVQEPVMEAADEIRVSDAIAGDPASALAASVGAARDGGRRGHAHNSRDGRGQDPQLEVTACPR